MTKNIWLNTVSGCKPTWQCWEDMRLRCTNPKIAKYQSYGAVDAWKLREFLIVNGNLDRGF